MALSDMRTKLSKLIKDPSYTAISSDLIDGAINQALRYYKQKRFWFNESEDTAVTISAWSSGKATISDMPTDILYPLERGGIVLDYSDQRYEVCRIRPEDYDAMNNETTDRPRYYTFRANAYEVYPYPDQAYTAIVRYIKDYSALSDSNTTNDFVTYAEDLLVYDAASRLVAEYSEDTKMETYFTARAKEEYRILLSRTNKNISTGSIAVYG